MGREQLRELTQKLVDGVDIRGSVKIELTYEEILYIAERLVNESKLRWRIEQLEESNKLWEEGRYIAIPIMKEIRKLKNEIRDYRESIEKAIDKCFRVGKFENQYLHLLDLRTDLENALRRKDDGSK